MPYRYTGPRDIIRPLTPKQLKAKMDRQAKKTSEHFRVIAR